MNIRVLVVDDEPLARVGITTRLGAYSDMLVVGECGTGEEALTSIPLASPDLISSTWRCLAFRESICCVRCPGSPPAASCFLPRMRSTPWTLLMWRRSTICSSRLTTLDSRLVSSVHGACYLSIARKPTSNGSMDSSRPQKSRQWRFHQAFPRAPGKRVYFCPGRGC